MEPQVGRIHSLHALHLDQASSFELAAQRPPPGVWDLGDRQEIVPERSALEDAQAWEESAGGGVQPVEGETEGGEEAGGRVLARRRVRAGRRLRKQLVQPRTQLVRVADLQLLGEHADRQRMEANFGEKIDEVGAPRPCGGRRRRELRQLGEPLDRIVGMGAAAQLRERQAPVAEGVLRMIEVGPARCAEDAGTARLGPRGRRVEELVKRIGCQGLEIVEDDERRRLAQGHGCGGGVGQALAEHRSDVGHSGAGRVERLHLGVVDEDCRCEKPAADQP
ncbi:MAG TPA: hypothetical protein VN970_08000, partial [Thermoanaerobaculia bacterium]|nr:hypothetical protein [Thermoanaerobaculia bacterium]